jgi:carboxymethylenebutenolidase
MAALASPACALAGSPEQIGLDADEGNVALTRYATVRAGDRASVLVLHGTRGVELNVRAYERYADALALDGIDAYLVRYFTAADYQALDYKTSTPESRSTYGSGRYGVWTKRVSSVVTAIQARPDSSRRIGLLGFSLGGYVAAASAAQDKRIRAVAVLYGGMPDVVIAQVRRMPPLIELHGENDRSVPLATGEELVKLARAVGASAEQIKGHGVDFSDTDPMTTDAIGRVVRFFRSNLDAA